MERTHCLKEVIKVAYFHYDAMNSFKLNSIYDEVSSITGKNLYTLRANVRLAIQDIIDNAPDNLLHSVFYISRKEANKNPNPKYFIIQIVDYLNNGLSN